MSTRGIRGQDKRLREKGGGREGVWNWLYRARVLMISFER